MSKIEKFSLILGSQSPRRKQLFNYLGIPFQVKVSQAEEPEWESGSASSYTLDLARLKAKALINELNPDNILVTSDTTVSVSGEILNKPENHDHAFEMIKKLSDKDHEVCTSFVISSDQKELYSESVVSKVICRKITDQELDNYLDQNEYLDKAGAYGIQGAALSFIEAIQGSYSNIVGFPIDSLIEYFRKTYGDDWRKYFG